MGRGVKGKGREKGGRGGKREGPPCSQPPPVKKSWIRACTRLSQPTQCTHRHSVTKNSAISAVSMTYNRHTLDTCFPINYQYSLHHDPANTSCKYMCKQNCLID